MTAQRRIWPGSFIIFQGIWTSVAKNPYIFCYFSWPPPLDPRMATPTLTLCKCCPKIFYTGNRKAQVLHVRIRTKCSSLNNDLYQKGINESPLCLCGHVENADHFLKKCHNYQAQRIEPVRAVSQHTSVTLQTLLFGNNSLPMNINIEIFEAVQTYIVNTKRF